MVVVFNGFWSSNDTDPLCRKPVFTDIPSNLIEQEMEKVALEHLSRQTRDGIKSSLYSIQQDDGFDMLRINEIPDEIWEKHGFHVDRPAYDFDFYFLDINKSCTHMFTPPLAQRLVDRAAYMTALLVERIEATRLPNDINKYMSRIQEFMSRVVPSTAYCTMDETLEIFQEELQNLPEDFWT